MTYEDLFNRLLILRTPNIGPVRYHKLINQYGNVGEVASVLKPSEAVVNSVKREIELANKLGVFYLSDDMEEYPALLRDIKNHPPLLSVRGNKKALLKKSVSMVGTRHATIVGMNFIADLAQKFSAENYVVVSGMAMGTDAAAHKGALRTVGDSQTIAVLAGGVDYIWPLENESLYWEIVERGAVVSEMPVGFVPVASNFVIRNRLIAWLGQKLILGEADLNSGSMKTAEFSYESNREIWAIPSHPTDSRSFGPNSLIKSGRAKLCTGPQDFFDSKKNCKKIESDNLLLDALGTIPVSESVLSEIVKKSISEIKQELVILELQGLVRKVDGGYIRL